MEYALRDAKKDQFSHAGAPKKFSGWVAWTLVSIFFFESHSSLWPWPDHMTSNPPVEDEYVSHDESSFENSGSDTSLSKPTPLKRGGIIKGTLFLVLVHPLFAFLSVISIARTVMYDGKR